MLHNLNCRAAILIADERALLALCGVSLVERQLRILQRLGIEHADVLCSNEAVAAHVAEPTWARAEIAVGILTAPDFLPTEERFLFLSGSSYYDARLLRTLSQQTQTTVLIDSSPAALAGLVDRQWLGGRSVKASLFDELSAAAEAGRVQRIDVAAQPAYLVDLRRELRPIWFPTPAAADTRAAESLLLDAAQNGTLDLPAIVHGPIETAIVARLSRTSVTPTQVTLFTAAVSAVVTILFARGALWPATLLALAVGVLDGVDGKLARVKVETTELGKREHLLDYVLELSWWAALAYHFTVTRQIFDAYALLLLLVSADVVDRLAKKKAKQLTGRNLDDVAPFDRFVRLLGGRRNIYIWMLACALPFGLGDRAFVAACWWGATTAAVHLLRVGWLARRRRDA